ncbi:uncharacterized protein BDZ83DRAFT_23604 [Colletotrichum acutatum]|uniref:Uncharacterized protein n=1 Tax=Glomerella acutata TaxID=27357 RepID=A0AAD8UBG8_GLOAC|nr:uncharacterized protein BDZ83DRAFT_23604 [Colletotrichum acutatum]KAK1717474.1 hypothetical protein BDZ83DRAFT_23604 [Colletotrichum acutatum]
MASCNGERRWWRLTLDADQRGEVSASWAQARRESALSFLWMTGRNWRGRGCTVHRAPSGVWAE